MNWFTQDENRFPTPSPVFDAAEPASWAWRCIICDAHHVVDVSTFYRLFGYDSLGHTSLALGTRGSNTVH